MKPTIKDVAKHANVSKATVSRILNNNKRVDKEIRQRVLESIKELNYSPNIVARNLANSSSNTIGLILPDITNPYFSLLARGVEDRAHQSEYTLFMSNADNNSDIEEKYIDKMMKQQVCGIILISSSLEANKVENLKALNIPFVFCDRSYPNTEFSTVSINNYRSSYEVVQYLIDKGHKKICHIAGPKFVDSAKQRIEGYLDAMKFNGLEDGIRVERGLFSFESGIAKMNQLLNEDEPTAVFAGNDLVAMGAIHAIQQRGLSVPSDIAVVGCDDILFAKMFSPALSTISIPVYEMGRKAVTLLDDHLKGELLEPKNIILDHEIIIRESCTGGIGI